MGRQDILQADLLTKRFGGKTVIDSVSFTARRGEVLGVLGPNGAGKSTLLNMISGLIEPDSGEIRIFGRSLRRDRAAVLARMNIASPYAALPGQLTVRENLSVYADLYGVSDPGRRIAALLDQLDVAGLAGVPISRLSSGQTIRIGLCKALLNHPDLLLLDEPTVYLDTEIATRARDLILGERAARGMTIVLTSHDFAEIERMCDRILLLHQGRIAAVGAPLDVTRAVLGAGREVASLEEAFIVVARRGR